MHSEDSSLWLQKDKLLVTVHRQTRMLPSGDGKVCFEKSYKFALEMEFQIPA